MRDMAILVSVVAVVVAVATYVTWVATRVDRLHARAAAARTALEAQSARRAAAAAELGERKGLAEAEDAAAAVRMAASGPDTDLPMRVEAENRLTKVLRSAMVEFDAETLTDVVETSRRLALARQVLSDRVRDARAIRRHWLVRVIPFARGHQAPQFFDIEDPALS
jgi:hypothetical protein